MITGSIDRAKLQSSLQRAAKAFGDSNKQALVRWSVQACREMAYMTQVFGRTKTKGKQEGAILGSALNIILVKRKGERVSKKRGLHSLDDVDAWIEENRSGRNGRTKPLPIEQKKECTEDIFHKAVRRRYKRAGEAKGGWLGAGQDIARRQTGQARVNIGKNVLSYAQKHASRGSARIGGSPFSVIAHMTNSARHSGSRHVIASGAERSAAARALPAVIKFYRRAMKAIDKKQ